MGKRQSLASLIREMRSSVDAWQAEETRVSDDGWGMSDTDPLAMAYAHATDVCDAFAELDTRIKRGESLPAEWCKRARKGKRRS